MNSTPKSESSGSCPELGSDAPPATFQQPLVLRALEELKMLSQNDIKRERYQARRKAILDYNTIKELARLKGEQIGIIHLCEQLLHRAETPTEQLTAMTLPELTCLAGELEAQLPQQK